MKKIITILSLTVLFISCSSDDDSGETPQAAKLKSFEQPLVTFGTSQDEIEYRMGDDYDTEPNGLSIGYKMVYAGTRDGEYQRAYSIDNDMDLWKTEVRYYGSDSNLETLKAGLESKYGAPEIGGGNGLVIYSYDTSELHVELEYLAGDNNAIVEFSEPN